MALKNLYRDMSQTDFLEWINDLIDYRKSL